MILFTLFLSIQVQAFDDKEPPHSPLFVTFPKGVDCTSIPGERGLIGYGDTLFVTPYDDCLLYSLERATGRSRRLQLNLLTRTVVSRPSQREKRRVFSLSATLEMLNPPPLGDSIRFDCNKAYSHMSFLKNQGLVIGDLSEEDCHKGLSGLHEHKRLVADIKITGEGTNADVEVVRVSYPSAQ